MTTIVLNPLFLKMNGGATFFRVEVQLGCKILNRMALFGMPESVKVA